MVKQLLKYQEVDGKLKAVEDSIKGSEEYRKFNSARKFLSGVEETRNVFEERSRALISNYTELRGKFQKLVDEKNEFESIIQNCGDDEVEYLNKQAQRLGKQLSLLEADLNRISSEMSELFAQYRKFVESTKAAVKQRDDYKGKYAALLKEKEVEMKNIETELNEISKGIPERVMKKYMEKRKDNKFPIVMKVNGNYCSACGTELSIGALSRLKQEEIIECENCRKLIFTE